MKTRPAVAKPRLTIHFIETLALLFFITICFIGVGILITMLLQFIIRLITATLPAVGY